MARYRVYYSSYPDCPEATEYSRSRAVGGFYIGGIIGFGTLGAVIYYISAAIDLFSKSDWANYGGAWGVLIAVAAIDLYYYALRSIITDTECNILVAKKRFASLPPEMLSEIINRLKCDSNAEIKRLSQNYILYFFSGAMCTTGIIGIVSGIYFLCHNRDGVLLLIVALTVTVLIILLTIHLAKKMKGTTVSESQENMKPEAGETENESLANNNVKFCRKCGTRILSDSIFCAKCGTRCIEQ